MAQKRARVDELDALSQDPEFWSDAEKAQALMRERGELADVIERAQTLGALIEEAELYLELAAEAGDDSPLADAQHAVQAALEQVKELEVERMFGGEHDDLNAFISINSGAGGTDSQDWAEMLLRMYMRYAQQKGWTVEINDLQEGQEAGIKGADLHILGRNAFGHLRAEAGIHRLVRISPFGKERRETSFAAVKVMPEIDDKIEIEVNEGDLRIDTYRSSGAGGQHVNTTDSAIRITHKPTGIVVQCQNERSQHKNRDTAMKMLKAKLYEREMAQREAAANKNYVQQDDIAFGSQIRSYVLHPYKQIKDLRTGHIATNVDRVLDGDLDSFVEAYLLMEGGFTERADVDDADA